MLRALGIVGGLNAGGFLLTAAIKSEIVTDLLGTGSIGLSAAAIAYGTSEAPRTIIASGFIAAWSARLSIFLAYRAFLYGDDRFKAFFPPVVDGVKGSWTVSRLKRLATFWVLQAVWGGVMLLPLLLKHNNVPRWSGWPGLALAVGGFAIEAVADYQKFAFKSEQRSALMTSGLYSVVQYPNYTGEIVFWLGLGVYWARSLSSFLPLAFAPAAFVTFLLVKVSGIPFSERARAKRFAEDPIYKAYASRTSKLIPGIY